MSKKSDIKISVIIPTYNAAVFLGKTLATLAKQDYRPFEVIVVDGNSDDTTSDIVDRYSGLVTTFISESDKGQLDAVQKGIRIASGDVLYWLNADDIVMPGTFRRVAEAFEMDSSVDYVFGDNFWFNETAGSFGVCESTKRLSFWDQFLFYGQLQVESFFWRREITHKAFPFDLSLRVYTDYSFFLPIRYESNGVWLPHRLGAFRVHEDQMSTANRHLGAKEMEHVKSTMRNRLGIGLKEFYRLRRRRTVAFFTGYILLNRVASVARLIARTLTGDRRRRELANFFYNEWLDEPERHPLKKLGASNASAIS
jgi:glycosyltransferase involved in cell wall biosynthesis